MLTFKEHCLINEEVLNELVELDEVSVDDLVNKVKLGFNTVKTFAIDQWEEHKEEILVTLVDILRDIQDEQTVGVLKMVVKTLPIPTLLKKVLIKLLSSRVVKKAIIPTTSFGVRRFVESIIEKNAAIKMLLVQHKQTLKDMEEVVKKERYERMVNQAKINFGHINPNVNKISNEKYFKSLTQKVQGKPHYTIRQQGV